MSNHTLHICGCIMLYTDGVAVPIAIYDNSNGVDNFIQLPGKSFMWKGNMYVQYSACA